MGEPVTTGAALVQGGLPLLGDIANIALQLYALKKQEKQTNEYNRLMTEQYATERSDRRREFNTTQQFNNRTLAFQTDEANKNRLDTKKVYDRDTLTGFSGWLTNAMKSNPSTYLSLMGTRR